MDIPANYAGNESAHSGNAYAGIYCFYDVPSVPGILDYREYLQHHLQAPLVAGEKYALTFWVSLADYSGWTVNDLGAYVSVIRPQQTPNPTPLMFNPQVLANPSAISINGWVPVTDTFQAVGGEEWITIGSFGNSQQPTATAPTVYFTVPYPNPLNTNPNWGSYYYIDDITLEIYPDPTFTWSGTCRIDFVDSTECVDTSYKHHWNFGDPSSGMNDSSNLQNPFHIFTQNGVPFLVTHTITSPNGGTFTYSAYVIQPGPPVANIQGYQTNNCGNGVMLYTSAVCDTNVTYVWQVTGGIPDTLGGCSININWGTNGGYVILLATDTNDCVSRDTLRIPACCHLPSQYQIDNTTASDVLATMGCVSGNVVDGNCMGNAPIRISGVFIVDVPIVFQNCGSINISTNTPILINSNQSLTFDNCFIDDVCDSMWDGIYIADQTASLRIINGSVVQYAKHAVVSNNCGNYFIENSTLRNNDTDMVINKCTTTHTGVVRGTRFNMSGPMLPALPALPVGHTETVCAIEIRDNANITIGDATLPIYQNRFNGILVGVRTDNSVATVINGQFTNFTPNAIQLTSPIDNVGTGIVATGNKGISYSPALTVGGLGLNQCTFTNMRIGIDVFERVQLSVLRNSMTRMLRFGVRVQRSQQALININDNFITSPNNSPAFNTAILVLECYNATVNIKNNTIFAPSALPNQTGVGIRVACVSPADVILNISSNWMLRVRTGIWLQQLVGKNHVQVNSNRIEFSKPNSQYTTVHYGIRLEGCATVRCDTNVVTKLTLNNPSAAMLQNLRGISIENSPVTYATDNIFNRLGSGLFGWETSPGSTLACNTMNRCYNGVFFYGRCCNEWELRYWQSDS